MKFLNRKRMTRYILFFRITIIFRSKSSSVSFYDIISPMKGCVDTENFFSIGIVYFPRFPATVRYLLFPGGKLGRGQISARIRFQRSEKQLKCWTQFYQVQDFKLAISCFILDILIISLIRFSDRVYVVFLHVTRARWTCRE